MIGHKELHYEGKATDLGALRAHIQSYLEGEGFKVHASAPNDQGTVLQAQKGGILRGLIDADRALTITVTGTPADLTVRVGIGKWLEHLAVAAIETLFVSELFLVVDAAESAWNFEIADKLLKDITTFVG
jgi:hypothetical protein